MSRTTIGLDEELNAYILRTTLRDSKAQSDLRRRTAEMPNAGMQIGADQGQFFGVLVKAIGAKLCLEVGVFTGYSALCVALALPADGRIVACDISREYTDIGRPFWEAANVAAKIDLRIGPAVQTLDSLIASGQSGTFDFVFIDADKVGYDGYYERALQLVRPRGLIAIDNVLWGGAVADGTDQTDDTVALRRLNEKLGKDERVDVAMLPIGDGVTLACKR